MTEVRCSQCNKMLGKTDGSYEICCPRCKTINSKIYQDKQRQEIKLWMEESERNSNEVDRLKAICQQLFYDNKKMSDAISTNNKNDAIIDI